MTGFRIINTGNLSDQKQAANSGRLVGALEGGQLAQRFHFVLDAAAFDATPKLKAFYETVASMPETKPLIEGTSPMGAMRQYFVAGPLH